jgi:ABC-type cobalamin/Fe3+-siderophores transport system ATPase subunit
MGKPQDVISPENIKAVYDIDVVVVNHTYPMIVPL